MQYRAISSQWSPRDVFYFLFFYFIQIQKWNVCVCLCVLYKWFNVRKHCWICVNALTHIHKQSINQFTNSHSHALKVQEWFSDNAVLIYCNYKRFYSVQQVKAIKCSYFCCLLMMMIMLFWGIGLHWTKIGVWFIYALPCLICVRLCVHV